MTQQERVTGMVISSMPVGEYDKRVVILTAERGKIHGFMHGARKPGSSLMASSEPFAFGTFEVYESRTAYRITSAGITQYFEQLRTDLDAALYGFYFLEFADYYGRENADDKEMLKLLYVSVMALCRRRIPLELIRRIFELRVMAVNGEGPQVFECVSCRRRDNLHNFSLRLGGMVCDECREKIRRGSIAVSPTCLYTMRYIVSSPYGKLFGFTLSDEVMKELSSISDRFRRIYVDKRFNSLEMIEMQEKLQKNKH